MTFSGDYTPPQGQENSADDIKLTTANVTGGGVSSKEICIQTGSNPTALGESGLIKLITGTVGAGGVRGTIRFQNGTEGTIGHVWTQINANGDGEWQPVSFGSGFLPLAGGTMSGVIDMSSNAINNVPDPILLQDPVTLNFFNSTPAANAANRNLSNLLSPTAINQSLIPDNTTRELGTDIDFWNIVRTRTILGPPNQNLTIQSQSNLTTSSGLTLSTGSASGNTGGFNFTTGVSTGGGVSGPVSIVSGTAASAGFFSGAITLRSGDHNGATGLSGSVQIRSGNVTNGSNSGGMFVTTGASSSGSGDTGDCTFGSGNSAIASTGETGNNTISTGSISNPASTRDTGNIFIQTGNNSSGNAGADSGNISLDPGSVIGGTRGVINNTQAISTNVVWENGVTGSRPGSPVVGQRFFDTTLGLPIWFDGATWIDAAGTMV
jgi:hypothetical protein